MNRKLKGMVAVATSSVYACMVLEEQAESFSEKFSGQLPETERVKSLNGNKNYVLPAGTRLVKGDNLAESLRKVLLAYLDTFRSDHYSP
ncbi:MAG TPA: hypothetical protein ENN60_00695 [archaeon]|nr:hypothetical protein [archaeon]